MDCRHHANQQQEAEQRQSHQDKHEQQEEHKEQGCRGSGQSSGDDNTGVERRRNIELHEEARRVLQRVSPSNASTSGINVMGGVGETTQAKNVHNHDQLPWPHLGVGAEAGSSSCLGSGSNTSTSSETRNLAQFDVFLNHRGPDVKMNFISHLDAALRRVSRYPFLDAKSLVKGHHALNSINEALCGVRVHVAVISPGYAKSKYCLNELWDMLVSKKPIIPVFYKVEPENLRWSENKEGPFAKAFSHHLTRGRDQAVVRWKEALKDAADITGFRFANNDNEEKLVKRVVDVVLKALPPARYPVGLKETSMDVVNMLHNMGDNVGIMGICDTGGIGTTTLAREVYNQEQSRFESWCFLKDVKDAKGIAIMDLQMKMVTNLLGRDVAKMVVDYARCLEMIQKKKCF